MAFMKGRIGASGDFVADREQRGNLVVLPMVINRKRRKAAAKRHCDVLQFRLPADEPESE
jgi:hypothetical protein